MKSLKSTFGLMAAGTLLMAGLPAIAVAIPESDVLQVLDNTGAVFKFTKALEGFPEGNGTMFIVDSDVGNAATFGNPTAFTEPGNPNAWSDMVGVILNPDGSGRYVLAYLSDTEGPLDQAAALAAFGAAAPFAVIPETGGLQDVTGYLNPAYSTLGFTAQFRSDVPDAGTSVALLGFALAGLGLARRKLA